MAESLKDSLLLPRTEFPMRAQLAEREPERLRAWQAAGLWKQIVAKRARAPLFVLHDGPPYANGQLHHGHLLNKLLKDIVIKDRTMAGFRPHYRPGWDCHGLPIETQVDKALGARKKDMSTAEVLAACRAHAASFVAQQKEGFERIGVFGDWDRPYLTMAPQFEGRTVQAFADLFATGLVFRGLRPVHWCTRHQTALAEAEVEYEDKRSHSLYVRFRVVEKKRPPALEGLPGLHLLIWTTTPWSLPGNAAVVVHPDVDYMAAPLGEGHVLIARSCYEAVRAAMAPAHALPPWSVAAEAWPHVRGDALAGMRYAHPFLPREGEVVVDDFVSMETGTGAVHSAPAHGVDDFAVVQRAGLPWTSPVDARGRLTDEAGPFAGQSLAEASEAIVAFLAASGALLSPPEARIDHRYAHCWRCHQPLITRATQQWFVAMDEPLHGGATLRQRAVQALDEVRWVPSWGVERIRGMLTGRPDWCVSRQRSWGVALPIVYCDACGEPWANPTAMRRAAKVVGSEGIAAFIDCDLAKLYGEVPPCAHCGGSAFSQGKDILDVWFDSGASWFASELTDVTSPVQLPIDLYLEGSDQHRGWFHSSLLLSVALRQAPPYKACMTHGFVVDAKGKKLSKSSGNYVDPFVSIGHDGAELWRLWVASEESQQDVRISPTILRQLSDHYRKLRNTIRYLLGNLNGFDPARDMVAAHDLTPLDAWAAGEAMAMGGQVRQAYEEFQFHRGTQRIGDFCVSFLSAYYLDALKDRLYADAATSRARLSAQTVLYVIARDLVRLLAPVLAFTADEAWQHLPGSEAEASSVHLLHYPGEGDEEPYGLQGFRQAVVQRHEALAPAFAYARQIRREANAALEAARRDKRIGASTEAALRIEVPASDAALAAALAPEAWAELLIVSEASVVAAERANEVAVEVRLAAGSKCQRCWLQRRNTAPALGAGAVCARCRQAVG